MVYTFNDVDYTDTAHLILVIPPQPFKPEQHTQNVYRSPPV